MQNCGYCQGGELLAKFGIKICDLEVSQLILFKEQSHPGRVIVAYKDHVSELVDISDEEKTYSLRMWQKQQKRFIKRSTLTKSTMVHIEMEDVIYTST